MSDLVQQFWERSECEEPLFSADEISWAPAEQFNLLCRTSLLEETAGANWVSCDACGDGHVEKVTWIRNAAGILRPFIPCPDVGGAALDPERLRQWAVDHHSMAQRIRGALGLVGNLQQVVSGRIWSLGRRHVAGRFRDFFLVRGAVWPDAQAVWDRCRHIEDASSPVVLAPLRRPDKDLWKRATRFRLADIGEITAEGLSVDLAYIQDSLPREIHAIAAKTVTSFPVPEDATWQELRLTVGDVAVTAELRGVRREFSKDELGLEQRRQDATRLWQVLCLLARFGGETPSRDPGVSEKDAAAFRKQVSLLRKRLSEIFPITGEPIVAVHGTGGYRCQFRIRLDRQQGFPTPPGTQWHDVMITELENGRIQVSVKSREVFAAKKPDQRYSLEVAERGSIRSEEYDLRTLGLANDAGHPTSEGAVLLAFLRQEGKVSRRGDDTDVLRLAQKLREWTGIDDGPLQFSPSRMLWSTSFDAQSLGIRNP